MKLIKIMGPALLATAIVMMLAATAHAERDTVLCAKATKSLTPTEGECEPIKSIHFETVGHAVVLGPVNIECTGLLSASTHRPSASAGLGVHFNVFAELKYSNCLGGCIASVFDQGSILILKTEAELAQVTGSGFNYNLKCFGLNCDYSFNLLVGHLLGGEKAHISYTKWTLNNTAKLSGFITCPATGALDALFQSLTAIYVRSMEGEDPPEVTGTLLCSNDTAQLTPTGECTVVKSIHLASAGYFNFFTAINVRCGVLLSASTEDSLVLKGPVDFNKNVQLTYSGCLEGCAVTVLKQGTVLILKTDVELADVTLSGFEINIKCASFNCDYRLEGLVGSRAAKEGTAHVTYLGSIENIAELSGTCPSSVSLSGLLESLGKFYIRS